MLCHWKAYIIYLLPKAIKLFNYHQPSEHQSSIVDNLLSALEINNRDFISDVLFLPLHQSTKLRPVTRAQYLLLVIMGGNAIVIKLGVLWILLLPSMTSIRGVEPLLFRPKQSPSRRILHIILHSKRKRGVFCILRSESLELIIIDPRPPPTLARLGIVHCKLIHSSEEDTDGMLVLTRESILRYLLRFILALIPQLLKFLLESPHHGDYLMMPWRIRHVQI
mmetsp:Transcript_643/g.868  ORF Transcript_643/g.868 Transcript_643/m.868 type:complete len:222 (-) Transcript_643:452-1117(-)